jgi:hypothetical protein
MTTREQYQEHYRLFRKYGMFLTPGDCAAICSRMSLANRNSARFTGWTDNQRRETFMTRKYRWQIRQEMQS